MTISAIKPRNLRPRQFWGQPEAEAERQGREQEKQEADNHVAPKSNDYGIPGPFSRRHLPRRPVKMTMEHAKKNNVGHQRNLQPGRQGAAPPIVF
jgi:hypothetical protein